MKNIVCFLFLLFALSGPSSSKEGSPPQKKHKPSEEEKENAQPDLNILPQEIGKEQPFKKHQSMNTPKEQEDMSSKKNLMWKEKPTSKYLKTTKEHASLGPKTARIKICNGSKIHYGTGFRVGSIYLLTAFHVVEDVLEEMWKTLHRELSPNDREKAGLKEIMEGKNVTKELLPEIGPWCVSELFQHLDKSERDRLDLIADQMFTDAVSLFFDYVDEHSEQSSVKVAYDIPFVSRSRDHDFVILKLESKGLLPEKMSLQKYFIRNTHQKFNLIGHPNGGFVERDKCQVIDEVAFEEWRTSNVSYFKNQHSKDSIIEEYECLQYSSEKIFFHASDSMGNGCSGGPIVTRDLNPKVIGFYHGGLPAGLYDNISWRDRENIMVNKPKAFIEKGISTEVIRKVLSKDESFSYLLEDIF